MQIQIQTQLDLLWEVGEADMLYINWRRSEGVDKLAELLLQKGNRKRLKRAKKKQRKAIIWNRPLSILYHTTFSIIRMAPETKVSLTSVFWISSNMGEILIQRKKRLNRKTVGLEVGRLVLATDSLREVDKTDVFHVNRGRVKEIKQIWQPFLKLAMTQQKHTKWKRGKHLITHTQSKKQTNSKRNVRKMELTSSLIVSLIVSTFCVRSFERWNSFSLAVYLPITKRFFLFVFIFLFCFYFYNSIFFIFWIFTIFTYFKRTLW